MLIDNRDSGYESLLSMVCSSAARSMAIVPLFKTPQLIRNRYSSHSSYSDLKIGIN